MLSKQRVRFLIFSDTHDIDATATPLQRLPSVDVILHCGDITENGDPERLKYALGIFAKMDAELKLIIPGNHDSTFDRGWTLSQHGDGRSCDEAVCLIQKYQKEGLHVLEEGTYTFTLSSGAFFSIYASPYSPAYGACALQYPSAEDRYNPVSDESRPQWSKPSPTANLARSIVPNDIDIMITHGPPKYILDRPRSSAIAPAVGCEHLRRAVERARPLLHAFGHVHCGYGAVRMDWNGPTGNLLPSEWVGKNSARRRGFAALNDRASRSFQESNFGLSRGQTLFVNSAIQNAAGLPENMPWYVELAL